MKIAGKSIQARILIPIFLFVAVVSITLLLLVFKISHSVSVKYFEFMLSRHALEVSKILDTAVNELISARLLDNTSVVEAKQKIALEQVIEYWERNDLEGLIIKTNGVYLHSSLNSAIRDRIRPFLNGPERFFHFETGLKHVNGYTSDFRAWDWKVVTIHKPVSVFSEIQRKEILFLVPIIIIGMCLLIVSIFVILRRNLQAPVKHILSDLQEGREIRDTGLTELDTIITATNNSFRELRDESARVRQFMQVIDSAFDLVLIIDEQRHITYINPACRSMTGYDPREVTGEKADLFFGTRDGDSLGNMWSVLLTGHVWRGEFFNKKKDGEAYQTSAVIFPIRSDDHTIFAAIQRDITQEKKLYEQLLRSQKLEAVGTLAGGFAHDFNNILTAILGYAEFIRDMTKEGDVCFKPANIILQAAEQGAELTKKILAITRKEESVVKPVNINDVIHTSMDLLQRSIPKTIEIVTRLSENLPPVLADASQLQQVIVNLAINSRDAMTNGGKLVLGTQFLQQETAGTEDRHFVKLFISDTGIGMDDETQRKVFDAFFTTKGIGKGTGLGLYIVHSIVSSYGGHINIYSRPGTGTTFNIYLPVAEKGNTTVIEQVEDLRGTGTVLVIDDEPHVRDLCSDLLALLGYKVLSAGGGAEGAEIFKELKDQIAVVVLDMIMPKMGGGEVYQALKAIKPDVRVILCSGYSEEGIAGIEALMKKGVKKFIQKPFSRLTLGRALKEVLQETNVDIVSKKNSGGQS